MDNETIDVKLLDNVLEALEATIEAAECHRRDVEYYVMELRDRREELLQLRNPPKIVDYRQDGWKFFR